MTGIDDLQVFERVAALTSFSAAARSLGLPKASVSRSVARLEARLGVRLFQRTTRVVALTEAGAVLRERSRDIVARVEDMFDYVGALGAAPRGRLRLSAGIGFGLNVLSELLPAFLERYPEVEIGLDMTSRTSELVAESIDVAIRMGPLSTSSLIATRLGTIHRYLCAAPSYLERRGAPTAPDDLAAHDLIELPGPDGRARPWPLTNAAGETMRVEKSPKIAVNDALTVHRLVVNGAGIGGVSGYLCAPDLAAGRLVRLLPGWSLPAIEVSAVFPSKRELSPTVRAFVNFLKSEAAPGRSSAERSARTRAERDGHPECARPVPCAYW